MAFCSLFAYPTSKEDERSEKSTDFLFTPKVDSFMAIVQLLFSTSYIERVCIPRARDDLREFSNPPFNDAQWNTEMSSSNADSDRLSYTRWSKIC